MIGKIYTILFVFFFAATLLAQDTVTVQTFTYDMISQRRGVFQFPEDTKQFRKILMLHSLKCDPRTPHDRFACGEWDYLTKTMVYKPTGRMDSTELEHPFFKLGWVAPDSIEYTSVTTKTIYQNEYLKTVIDNVSNEESFNIGTQSSTITLDGNVTRMQFILASKELKEMGLTKGEINKIAFNVTQPGDAVLRMSIRIKNAPAGQLTNFINYGFDTVYYSDVSFNSAGWHKLMFNKPYKWTGFSSILIEISYQKISGKAPVLAAWSAEKAIRSFADDRFLYFDGTNDAVIIENKMSDFYGAEKLTIEGWVKVNSWQAWNRLFGTSKTTLVLGGKKGQIYCIVRNPNNTHGNVQGAITTNEWHHIAMVFDGTKSTNKERLKLYVDGKQKTLAYNGTIPATTDTNYNQLSFSGLQASNQSLKGGLDEIRIWKNAMDGDVIKEWFNKKVNNSHPDYSDLLAYYSFDNNNGTTADDEANGKYPGTLIGCPAWVNQPAVALKTDIENMPDIPVMKFFRGDYTTHTESNIVENTVDNAPISIVKYEVDGHSVKPSDIIYAWAAGYTYKYDKDRNRIDSTYNAPENKLINHTLTYFGEPFEVIDKYEIGRFITPYGINLDLGPDGFTWAYDVTDYADLLQGQVDLSSGNLQELIDLKFLFIKGTAPRDVIDIKKVWGDMRSYKYKDLSADTKLSEIEVPLNPEAKQFKLITRLTGHGHNSNDGSSPHCCEWKDNTHYLIVNSENVANWHIWQTYDCALNPVYPQGGTWPGSREGWCPGDLVKDHNFELTKYIEGNSVKLDYDITPVPQDNLGMGNGVYYMAMHLIEYGESKFDHDCEVYNVIMPSNNPYYSRKNPICANPMIIVRNNGKQDVTALTFKYKVSGGEEQTYNWTGTIPQNEMITVSLPIPNSEFWIGDNKHAFTVTVLNEDGTDDDYPGNSTYLSHFNMPDLLPEKIIIEYKTNKRPQHYTFEIKDLQGNVVFSKSGLFQDRLYRDTLDVPQGCYTFEFTDLYKMGLSYWAYPAQGSGYVRFLDLNNKVVKAFNPDCGRGYNYAFNLGHITMVQENNENYYLQPFPNPTMDYVYLTVTYPVGNAEISVYDIMGKVVWNKSAYIGSDFNIRIPTEDMPTGIYFIRVQNNDYNLITKFVKK
jgi:hypothetical protein